MLNKLIYEKCPNCGKRFLGCAIDVDNSNPSGTHPGPVNIKIYFYPLSCGKCPECAKKCFAGNVEHKDQLDLNYEILLEYVKKNSKIPCEEKTILEFYNMKADKAKKFTEEEIKGFIDSMMESVDCCAYLDKFHFLPEWDTEYKGRNYEPQPWDERKDFLGGKLVNLFDLIENEIENNQEK